MNIIDWKNPWLQVTGFPGRYGGSWAMRVCQVLFCEGSHGIFFRSQSLFRNSRRAHGCSLHGTTNSFGQRLCSQLGSNLLKAGQWSPVERGDFLKYSSQRNKAPTAFKEKPPGPGRHIHAHCASFKCWISYSNLTPGRHACGWRGRSKSNQCNTYGKDVTEEQYTTVDVVQKRRWDCSKPNTLVP